jgi:hypothetical protein
VGWIDDNKKLIVSPPDAIGANKTQKPLIKPMTTQIINLLSFWKSTGFTSNSKYVFGSVEYFGLKDQVFQKI